MQKPYIVGKIVPVPFDERAVIAMENVVHAGDAFDAVSDVNRTRACGAGEE